MYFALVLALAVGSVQGVVTDQRAPLWGCTVTLTSSAGKISSDTNREGEYRFYSVEPGPYELLFEVSGFESLQRSIEVVEGVNEQPEAELVGIGPRTITIKCSVPFCQDSAPASVWDPPACSDFDLDTALIESLERGDRSAAELLGGRFARAATWEEKHTIAAALLRRVPDDSVYWNELVEHARNAVRFRVDGPGYTDEFVKWCQERMVEPEDYQPMAFDALTRIFEDRRSHPLLLQALEVGELSLVDAAILGLATQRDLRALPAIQHALDRSRDRGVDLTYTASLLSAYENEQADQLAFRYLTEDEREEYLEARMPPEEEEEEE